MGLGAQSVQSAQPLLPCSLSKGPRFTGIVSLPVCVPTVEGLLAASFSFASRLHLAVSLRLPSSASVGSFHPTRFCPCWAHAAAAFRGGARPPPRGSDLRKS